MSEEQNTKTENEINKETQESNTNNNIEEEKENIKKDEEKEENLKNEEEEVKEEEKENIKKEEKKEKENENIKKEEENKKEEEKEKEEENIKKEETNPPKTAKGKNFNIDDYILMLSIGTGNFSEVHLVEHKTTKILYALKSFEKRRVESLHKERDVLMEKYALEKISPHKNIIGYYGSTKDDFEMYILYEYINGGDLWHRKVIYGIPSEKLIKFYFIQIIEAVKHIHSFNIAHRDLKPENIMITKDNKTVKLIDFGSSLDINGTEFEKKIEEMKKKEKKRRPDFIHFVGTPNYMAPECVHNQFSDKRCDLWSLGCILYDLYVGFPPFNGASEYLIFQKSIKAKYIFPEGIIPDLAQDFIKKCIVIEPDKRMTLDEMLKHPLLINEVNDKNFLEEIPQMTPEEKKYFDIKNILKEKYDKFKDISNNLEAIKNHEKMEEDLKRNEITPDPSTKDEKIELLCSKKDEYQKEYDQGLKDLNKDINEYKIKDDVLFNQKMDFLETRIKHDLFHIIYRGFEYPPEKNDLSLDDNNSESSDSEQDKKEDNKK